MIPKEFKKTTEYKEEFDKYIAQFEYVEIPEEFEHLPPSEVQKKEYEVSEDYELKEKTKHSFSKEYKELTSAKTYFLGCTFNSYNSTYGDRLKVFKAQYIDAEEHNFIIEELDLIRSYHFLYLIENDLKKNIKYSLEKTIRYLKEKLKSLGYEIKNTTKDGKMNSIAVKGDSIIKLNNEPTIDLSDSKPIDRIRALGLIGFFKNIKDREPHLSINQIASLTSAITDINQRTVQSYINPILSTDVSQEKNPFNKIEKVTVIKNTLISIGLKNFETL